MEKIILIGGAPTVGKSYLARKLSKSLGIPWISTDTIRSQMRKKVKKKDYPKIFFFGEGTNAVATDYLTNHTPSQIVKHQNEESEEVWIGVSETINNALEIKKSLIIEGVAVLPYLASKRMNEDKRIRVAFLVDENVERIRKTIFTRGLWDKASKYPDSVKEKEVEWVMAFNDYIKKEAKKYGLPLVTIKDRESYLNDVKKIISK